MLSSSRTFCLNKYSIPKSLPFSCDHVQVNKGGNVLFVKNMTQGKKL